MEPDKIIFLVVIVGSTFALGVLVGVRYGIKWTRRLFIRELELDLEP